jgi:hypothetical protein
MKTLAAIALLLLATSGVATAGQGRDRRDGDTFRLPKHLSFTAIRAPEIDPASVIAGLSLLGGGLAVLRGRRSKKPPS